MKSATSVVKRCDRSGNACEWVHVPRVRLFIVILNVCATQSEVATVVWPIRVRVSKGNQASAAGNGP